MKKTNNKFIVARASKELHDEFKLKTELLGGSSKVLRELIEAFVDDRITITLKKEYYHVD